MTDNHVQSGFADVNGAKLYYELAGNGQPFVMIHAGVADRRQWNNEFTYFADHYQVLRFDTRGYGKSVPVPGEYNTLDDFVGLLDALEITGPIVLMGCSMGGMLAMDFALDHPDRVKALIMVGSQPSGYWPPVEDYPLFADAEAAWEAGDIDKTAEIETRIWFEGDNRDPVTINPAMRQLAYDMNHLALSHEAKKIGKRVKKEGTPANDRLDELTLPVLVIVGGNDLPEVLVAADHMEKNLTRVEKVVIPHAAHLSNMDQPQLFQQTVDNFLAKHT